MATSINQVVSSESSIGGGIYAPPKRTANATLEDAPSAIAIPLRRRNAQPEVEIFLIAVREPYRSTLSRLMVLLTPFQEQLAKAAHQSQQAKRETSTYSKRERKPWQVPSFFGKGLLRALVR